MLVQEFIDRTGYAPTADEYSDIQDAYYLFQGDKDMYCKAWAKANPHKAGTLWKKEKEAKQRSAMLERIEKQIWRKVRTFKGIWDNLYSSVDKYETDVEAEKMLEYCGKEQAVELLDELSNYHANGAFFCQYVRFVQSTIENVF